MQELLMEGAITQGYRLSPQQRRLFILQQDDPNPCYVAQAAILIEGDLDAKLLDSAIQKVIDRSDSLRTSFARPKGLRLPVQVIADRTSLVSEKINLLDTDPRRQEEELDQLLNREKRRQFHLAGTSLLRLSLIALSANRHILLITLPALCADVRTLDNILSEIGLYYGPKINDESLNAGPPQYIQFSEWQNELLDEDDESEGREFWHTSAGNKVEQLPLPFGEARSSVAGFTPEVMAIEMAPDLAARVRALARQYKVTVDVFVLACWQTLLSKLTGRSEISMAIMCDGRKFKELNDSLGLFAKWLPLSVHIDNGIQFGEALRQAQQRLSETYEWQEYFIWGGKQGNDGDEKYYPEIGFEYERRNYSHDVAGVRFSIYRKYTRVDRSNLKLTCIESRDSIKAEFQFDSNLFEVGDIRRLAAEFQALLVSVVHNPGATVGKLRVLDEAQREEVLFEFNNTAADYPQDHCLHKLFERQVERAADAVAAVFEGEQLSYANLNQRTNQLAHHLRNLNVGPETIVGICIERSLDMIVGVLGILKVGGAYVPIDPEYPRDRQRFMIEDAQATILLTNASLAASLLDHAASAICLDADWALFARGSQQNAGVEVSPDNLAYVIYTSGSTGKPKGAMNTHRGVSNRQLWMQDTYPLTWSDNVLQLSSFSFDFSVWEIIGTLSAGARLVLVRPAGHKDTAYIPRLMVEESVTVAHFVPSMLQAVLEEPGLEACDSLKRVFCGGEALSLQLQERIFSRLRAELHNQYGPTEASIDVTFWDCLRDSSIRVVPIGRPNANNSIQIVDCEGEPNPIGVSGELLIGGIAVGRGYFGKPDLTAEKFVPDPFASVLGARLYCTGDLARYRSDGNIEYQGRKDEQIKIRGFRIELAEIEAILNGHHQVRKAVVAVHEGPAGDKRLVGYVVPTRNQAVSGADLRNYAAEKLPDYMVPAYIIEISEIPLTASGKVDRKTLSKIENIIEQRPQRRGPRNVVEEVVSGIWSEVLGLEAIGMNDNFFDIGGHSLLATQTVSRMREAFSVDLDLKAFFDRPTIEALSDMIELQRRAVKCPQAPAIKPMARDGDFPLSFAQQRLWFIDQFESGGVAYLLPVALRMEGELNIAAFGQVLGEAVARHESLRTIIKIEGGTPRQFITAGDQIRFALTDLRALSEGARQEQMRRLTQEEATTTIDLSVGPLFRARLLLMAEGTMSCC